MTFGSSSLGLHVRGVRALRRKVNVSSVRLHEKEKTILECTILCIPDPERNRRMPPISNATGQIPRMKDKTTRNVEQAP